MSSAISSHLAAFVLASTLGAHLALTVSVAAQVNPADYACLKCHAAPTLARAGKAEQSVSIEVGELANSVHAGVKCNDCHTAISAYPHPPQVPPVDCAHCHLGKMAGPVAQYPDSVHGRALINGDRRAPLCQTCHGDHDIRSVKDPLSRVSRMRIPETCGQCHIDGEKIRGSLPASQAPSYYTKSVHGRGLTEKGLTVTAVCSDCHGVHSIQPAADPRSLVSRKHIAQTCSKCHLGVYKDYLDSVHGTAASRGVREAPVCTDCHGEHTIYSPREKESSVYPAHVSQTCSNCHENARIQTTFAIPAERITSYMGSYHGIAGKYGDVTVANCATCHAAHKILPSSDPRSMVNKANLPHTCGKCHPGAGPKLADSTVHGSLRQTPSVMAFYVKDAYRWMIALMIGAFAAYIGLDLFAWSRARRSHE